MIFILTFIVDFLCFNTLQFLNGSLHNISLLAAEMTNLVVKYFELVRCCGLTILLDDCTHAVVSHSGVQYVSHFKESFVRGVLDQYTVELRLQTTFKEVEI